MTVDEMRRKLSGIPGHLPVCHVEGDDLWELEYVTEEKHLGENLVVLR